MEQKATAEIPGGGEHYLVARKRKRRRNALLLTVLAAAGAGGWYWHQSRDTAPEDQPLIVAVGYGDIENTIASAGALEPSRVVDLGAQVSGQLQRLFVEVGQLVEAGELLAEIDARVQQNRVDASRASIDAQYAQIEAREASLELAVLNAERQKRLWEDNATSELDYQNATNNLVSARANLTQLKKQIIQSEASLESDETQLEFTKIVAPMSGTIVEILLNEGVTLNANQQAPTILRIADLSRMTVETQISEADIGRVKAGMEVYFTTLGGGQRRWYSKLEQILPSPVIESNVVLYTGLFTVDNADAALLSGMTTQVYFVTSSAQNVLTVPVGALTYRDAPSAGAAARMAGARQPAQEGRAGNMPPGGFPEGGFPVGEGSPRSSAPPRGFPPDGFPPGARPGGEGNGSSSRGGADSGFTARIAGADDGSGAPRPAVVKVVRDDGSVEEREILVGVTSRVTAEVITGLLAGERVVAGIVQNEAPAAAGSNNNNNGSGIRGIPGGFRPF